MGLVVLLPHLSMAAAIAWVTPDRSSSVPQLRAFAAAREMASDAWPPPGMHAEKMQISCCNIGALCGKHTALAYG